MVPPAGRATSTVAKSHLTDSTAVRRSPHPSSQRRAARCPTRGSSATTGEAAAAAEAEAGLPRLRLGKGPVEPLPPGEDGPPRGDDPGDPTRAAPDPPAAAATAEAGHALAAALGSGRTEGLLDLSQKSWTQPPRLSSTL